MAAPAHSRARAKAETREALLRAGIEEIAARGLDAPSLDAICARAGYTRGAFYVHFRDRDDFLVGVMERLLGAFLDGVIATGDEAHDLEETVRRFAGMLAARGREAPPMQFQRLLEVCARSPAFRARLVSLLREAVARVARATEEGQLAGSVRRDLAPAAAASLLVALALGGISALEVGVPVDIGAVRDALLRCLAPPAPRPS